MDTCTEMPDVMLEPQGQGELNGSNSSTYRLVDIRAFWSHTPSADS